METKDIQLGKIYTTEENSQIFIPLIKHENHYFNGTSIKSYGTYLETYKCYSSDIVSEFNLIDFLDKRKKKLIKAASGIQIKYITESQKMMFISNSFKIRNLKIKSSTEFSEIIDHIVKEYDLYKNTVKVGENLNSHEVIIAELEPDDIKINTSGIDITQQYSSIVSNVSQITKDINAEDALSNHKEIAEAFVKAKQEISKLSTVKPNKFGYVGEWITSNVLVKSKIEEAKELKAKNQSTQENIDYLFGVVYEKYENLIKTGEGLQKSKAQMNKQIEALNNLEIQSDEQVNQYTQQSDIPIRELAINTQIKTSIEKYKQRLTKIDGAIIATQTTITSLAKDLPAMKNDLTDEMAISSLLGSVDDYQVMYQEIAKLVSEVTTSTAEKTHVVIENLLQMQIEDTHTINYLVESGKRAEKLATMLTDKTTKLTKKVQRDAEFIGDIAKGNTIEHARSKYKLLK